MRPNQVLYAVRNPWILRGYVFKGSVSFQFARSIEVEGMWGCHSEVRCAGILQVGRGEEVRSRALEGQGPADERYLASLNGTRGPFV